jgi:hypothetical protein
LCEVFAGERAEMTADDPEYVLVGGLDAKARAHTRTGGMNDDERYGDRTEVGHFNTDNKAGSTGTTVRSPSSISHTPATPRRVNTRQPGGPTIGGCFPARSRRWQTKTRSRTALAVSGLRCWL